MNKEEEEKIVSEYNALRQVRRDNKKSIVKTDDGLFLTSVVYTDPKFSKRIIEYFSPQFKKDDLFIDPCRGVRKSFYNALPKGRRNWCEIQEGKDYLEETAHYDWCFANFPWRGRVYSELAKHSFEHSDNVVSLVKFSTALGTNKRFKDATNNNMMLKEIIFVPWQDAGFTFPDGSIKAPEGFILAVIHWQRNWMNGTTWNSWVKLNE